MNSILKMMFTVWVLPLLGNFFTGSQTFTTDLATVKTSFDSGADAALYAARAIDPAGPITDVDGMLANLQTKFNEAAEIINYLIYGKQGGTGTGGIFKVGDGTAANTYTKLGNILTSLTS